MSLYFFDNCHINTVWDAWNLVESVYIQMVCAGGISAKHISSLTKRLTVNHLVENKEWLVSTQANVKSGRTDTTTTRVDKCSFSENAIQCNAAVNLFTLMYQSFTYYASMDMYLCVKKIHQNVLIYLWNVHMPRLETGSVHYIMARSFRLMYRYRYVKIFELAHDIRMRQSILCKQLTTMYLNLNISGGLTIGTSFGKALSIKS